MREFNKILILMNPLLFLKQKSIMVCHNNNNNSNNNHNNNNYHIIKNSDNNSQAYFCFRRKAENCAEWRANEESRRLAVENALEELLARDTQYR
jgi:hypothetical protein